MTKSFFFDITVYYFLFVLYISSTPGNREQKSLKLPWNDVFPVTYCSVVLNRSHCARLSIFTGRHVTEIPELVLFATERRRGRLCLIFILLKSCLIKVNFIGIKRSVYFQANIFSSFNC